MNGSLDTLIRDRDVQGLDAQLLSDLWYFRFAARLCSITSAAQRLGLTQGAVSQRIQRLEQRLGTAVFVRQKGGVQLTDAGALLLEAMTKVALVLNESLGAIQERRSASIVVGCLPSMATEWLVPHLSDFYATDPEIEVVVRSELAPWSAGRLEDDGVDIVIDYRPGPAADLHELASVQEMIFPVCSPRYRDALAWGRRGDAPVTLLHDDLPWVGGTPDSEWDLLAMADAAPPGRPVGSRHFNAAHLAYGAAAMHQGVAVGHTIIAHRLLTRGDLVPASRNPPVLGAAYRASVVHPGGPHSPVRRFARWWRDAALETQAATMRLLKGERRATELATAGT
jgi:DNA-binding transcriptional LysR family regulator